MRTGNHLSDCIFRKLHISVTGQAGHFDHFRLLQWDCGLAMGAGNFFAKLIGGEFYVQLDVAEPGQHGHRPVALADKFGPVLDLG
jgi:hypothetical protein